MDNDVTAVDVTGLPAEVARRVLLTVSCRDTDSLPKVAGAGEISTLDGRRVQTMHNGVLVEAGGYFGDWMSEIIRGLRGHHEPQEEVVFQAVLDRLDSDPGSSPVMVEPGCFWAYYSIWFARRFPRGRVLALEPDAENLALGRRNAALNAVSDRIDFRHAMVGPAAGEVVAFTSELSGLTYEIEQFDLAMLLAAADTQRIDLIACDIQGAETALLGGGRELLRAGRVRFLIVSTHHHSISGDPLTHERALALVEEVGGHVIAEHSVAESYSGDGLIAASFDPRDAEFSVPVSHARPGQTLFAPLEQDLAAAWGERDRLLAELSALRAQLQAAQDEREAATGLAQQVARERAAMQRTVTWRWSRRPAQLWARLRRVRQG